MDAERRALRLGRINAKGMDVAQRLSDLLAGKDVELSDFKLTGPDDTELRKEDRLRRFLDQINGARKRLGTEAYGRCVSCDAALEPAALDEQPWLERCSDCEAAGR